MKKEFVLAKKSNRKKEIYQAIKKSNKLIDNFNVYFQVFRSNSVAQISQISKKEYNSVLNNPYYISTKEAEFRKKIDKNKNCESTTLELNSNNFALAFNPFVWSTLSLEQKIAAVRIASINLNNKDVNEFANYNSNSVVLCGKNYNGAFNIGAFFREDIDSIDILRDICDFNNLIKESFYHNKSLQKNYDSILDFETFEEMQYLSPLEPVCDFKDASPEAKAFFWDQIFRRNSRAALLQSLDLLNEASRPIEDLSKNLYEYINNASNDITTTNLFVMQKLGCNVKERDEKYLKIKNDIFNQQITKEYNDLVDLYDKDKKELNNSNASNNKNLLVKLKLIYNEMTKLKNQILSFDDAKNHFKDYFEKDTINTKKPKFTKDNSAEDFEKMN